MTATVATHVNGAPVYYDHSGEHHPPNSTMLGFWLGSFDFVRRNIEVALILVVAVSLIPMAVEWVRHRRERSREDAGLDAA